MVTFQQFLNELSQEDLTKIGKQVNVYSKKEFEDIPFNNIFDDKSRIVIPMLDSQEQSFKDNIEKLGYRVDLKQGLAFSEVETQKGSTERSQKIGKLIQRIIKNRPQDSDFWKEQAHWWEKNRENVGRISNTGVSIIVSRHPIDIIRMSDHDEFDSCHTPGRSYFRCAIQEAKTGGAVAYIVRNSDLKNIKNLQKKDIFKDKDRDIEGIEPLERIRLRRFSDEDTNLLVPEKSAYGIKHVGFYEAIKDWALNAQKIDPKNPPDLKQFDLYGGSYQDNDASELWNSFFGTDVHVNKYSKDQAGEGNKDMHPDYLEERAQQQLDEHEADWKHYSAYFEASEEGLWYNASVCFEFPEDEFEYELDLGYGRDSLSQKIKDTLDIYVIDDINLQEHRGDNVSFCLDISHEPDGYQEGPLGEFEAFLDGIDGYDNDYNEHYTKLYNLLVQEEYIRNWVADDLNLQNMEVETVEKTGAVTVRGEMDIGYLMGLKKDNVEKIFGQLAYSSKPGSQVTSQIFPKFIPPDDVRFKIDQKYIGYYMGLDHKNIIQNPIIIKAFFDVTVPHQPNQRKKMIVGLNYLDKNWEYYTKRAIHFWDQSANAIRDMENPRPFQPKINPNDRWKKFQDRAPLPPIQTPRPKTSELQQMFSFEQEPQESFKEWLKLQETTPLKGDRDKLNRLQMVSNVKKKPLITVKRVYT